jgi:predicted AlkP superfamily pyrophosphatase or phosphodiesterase
MSVMIQRLALACLALVLSACAAPPGPRPGGGASTPAVSAANGDLTLLVSIDGFRPDYLDRTGTPTLFALAAAGTQAQMRPSFPSVTFPNHHTLVTGLTPDHHGLINNRMEDPARPGVVFTIGNRAVASDPFWWAGGTPIWVTAEKAGVATATMFWPGSDYVLEGVRPQKFREFDQTLPDFARVDQLLRWLESPDTPRARFATLYFDIVDTAGHRYGPDSPDTRAAAAQVDAAIARLVDGLKSRDLYARTNLVIVADHGMAAISGDRLIDLDALAGPDIIRVVWDGPFAGVMPQPGREADAERALVGRKGQGECWRKGELPARFAFGRNPRVPAIICLADVGWRYRTAAIPPYAGPNAGAHGYDPAAPEMAALFLAHGPAFRSGVVLPAFDNVSVYPLLAKLIGVAPRPNDGSLDDVAAALR